MSKYIYSNNKQICNNCQAEYLPTRKNQKFCSISCSVKQQHKNYLKNYSNKRNCLYCNSEFIVKKPSNPKKFCSKSCSAKYNNQKRINDGWEQPEETEQKISKSLTKFHHGFEKYTKTKTKKLNACIRFNKPHPDIVGEYDIIEYNSCAHCHTKFISKTRQKYCYKHTHFYSINGRAKYQFNFNVFEFPELFDLELIKKIGFYSTGITGQGKIKPINLNGLVRDHKVSII